MSEPTPGELPRLSPLLPADPPKVGDFWLDARLAAAPSGVAFIGHDESNTSTIVILLSEGAAGDAGARDRFSGTVNQLDIDTVIARGGQGQNEGRLGHRFRDEPDDPQIGAETPATPWVALAYDASPASVAEANRILSEVDLSMLGQQGRLAGPDYRLHWIDWSRPGIAKVWPLPWPGRHDRSGWLSILASWLLMLLLCALAVLIAILIFRNSGTEQPPPPVPTSASTPQSASPSPESASPSPESASPSPESASPSPTRGSAHPSPSRESVSPSPQTASPSSGGSPTPNSKL
jgi:hypothetical protein